jgi:hypothetical protein
MRNEKLSKIPDGEFVRTVVGGFPTEEELNQREREYNEMMAARESQQNAENQSNTENKPSGESPQTDETPETKPKDFSRRVELKFGYQEKDTDEGKGALHRDVVISRRPTAADYGRVMINSELDIEITIGLLAASITKFGGIKIFNNQLNPVFLYDLNEVDITTLLTEQLVFDALSQLNQEAEILEADKAKLAFGVVCEGVKYDVVRFGNILKTSDNVRFMKEAQNEAQRQMMVLIHSISELSTADGSQTTKSKLTLEEVEQMDSYDYRFLKEARGIWLASF